MLKQILDLWPVLVVLMQGAAIAGAWWFSDQAKKYVDQKVATVKAEQDEQDTRLQLVEASLQDLEGDIKNLPTKADIARLEGEVKAAYVEAAASNAGVKRMEMFFLKRGVDGV